MFKMCNGHTRIALILFRWLVIKFPNPRFDRIRSAFEFSENFAQFSARLTRVLYEAFVWGVVINASEGLVSVWCTNAHHLSPVITLGILNLQWYEGEGQPTDEEIEVVYRSLSPKARSVLEMVNAHDKSAHKWRKTPKGLRLIDYGVDPFQASWGAFLNGSQRELTQATAKK